jgi:hypothetical protein
MDDYILNRLRIDAAHVLERAKGESNVQHPGVKGRFREILIDNMLLPWLPPYVSCGTGTIIDGSMTSRKFTQDDVIVYDRSLAPPILAGTRQLEEGRFLYNSVLARIEVKSTLKHDDIRKFVRASVELSSLKMSVRPKSVSKIDAPYNLLFAYESEAKGDGDRDFQLRRIIKVIRKEGLDPDSGLISMICIPPHGFWKIIMVNGSKRWGRLTRSDMSERLAWFVGCTSSSCYIGHAKRQGRDPDLGVEAGIGMFIPGDTYEEVPGPY